MYGRMVLVSEWPQREGRVPRSGPTKSGPERIADDINFSCTIYSSKRLRGLEACQELGRRGTLLRISLLLLLFLFVRLYIPKLPVHAIVVFVFVYQLFICSISTLDCIFTLHGYKLHTLEN